MFKLPIDDENDEPQIAVISKSGTGMSKSITRILDEIRKENGGKIAYGKYDYYINGQRLRDD